MRLRKHLEEGWKLETPGQGVEDPDTGVIIPGPVEVSEVAVSIQQRSLGAMTELNELAIRDERVAVVLPPVEIPQTARLVSPAGEVWNCSTRGIIRRSAFRKPVYTAVEVRRAEEQD